MNAVTFDTLKFVKTLQSKAKFTQEQAEGVAEAFIDATNEQLVTKADLTEALAPIKTDMTMMKADISILKWMVGFVLAFIVAIFYMLIKGH